MLHWQWKINEGKQTEGENNRGRIIFAIDTACPFGVALLKHIEGVLAGLEAERKI